METNRFVYSVEIRVIFTDEELSLLHCCCTLHYDQRTRSAAMQGGFIYGWINHRNMTGNKEQICSFDQLDTCAKALEQPLAWKETDEQTAARSELRTAIVEVLQRLNAETRRMNDGTYPIGGNCPAPKNGSSEISS
ncbi:MAG: hypothetical protein ACXAC5_01895 [Promethearchaeota archaeon]|jgi:hypothetical protein